MKKILIVIFFWVLAGAANCQVRVQGTLPSPTDITYASLKLAFDDINAGVHQGAITIMLGTSNNQTITETSQAVLNKSGSGAASYTSLLITPGFSNITINATINGTSALDIQGIIRLNGAQNVVIDGRIASSGTTNDLTIENTSTGTYATALCFCGASDNILRYCTIKSSTKATVAGCGTLSFFNNGAAGCCNNLIAYCTLTKSGANLPKTALASTGSSTGRNINNTVRYCTISDFARFGIWLGRSNSSSNGYNESWTIDNNTFFETSIITIDGTDFSNYAINVGYHDSGATSIINNETGTFTITNNLIGGNGSGGNWTVTSTSANTGLVVGGIYLGASVAGYSDISGNIIKNFNITTYVNTNTVISGYNGIYVYHSKVKIGCNGGNLIHDITLDHKSTWGGVISGITIKNNANYNCEIRNNQVYNITALTGTSYFQYFYGIYDWSESSLFDDIVCNNKITNINVNLNSNCFGINASGAITQNHISNINVANGTADLTGIYFFGVTTANRPYYRVENNEVILGLDNAGGSTATGRSVYGITINGIGYAYYNSVLIRGTHSGSTNTCCLKLSNSSGPGFNDGDNLLYNARTGGSGKHYCIMTTGSNAITSFNNAYVLGTGANNMLGRWNNSTDHATLATWATAASESNSISETIVNKPVSTIFPNLATSGNLSVSDQWLCAGAITATIIDFTGTYRSTVGTTTIGAYEQVCSLLPVGLESFDAVCGNDLAEIIWKTYSESNNDYFTVERSSDLIQWDETAKIAGAGNSNGAILYSYIDKNPLTGITYYRLRQTDYDGKYSYSEIITLKDCPGQNANDALIFPNPFNNEINIDVSLLKSDKIDIRMVDADGKVIYDFNSVDASGEIVKIVFKESIGPGVYFIEIRFSGTVIKKRVVRI